MFWLYFYVAFKALLDNYELECGEQEVVTNEERKENRDFIDAIMETDVMQEAHRYLVEKNKAPKDKIEFKRLLYKTWFSLVRRTKGDRWELLLVWYWNLSFLYP